MLVCRADLFSYRLYFCGLVRVAGAVRVRAVVRILSIRGGSVDRGSVRWRG